MEKMKMRYVEKARKVVTGAVMAAMISSGFAVPGNAKVKPIVKPKTVGVVITSGKTAAIPRIDFKKPGTLGHINLEVQKAGKTISNPHVDTLATLGGGAVVGAVAGYVGGGKEGILPGAACGTGGAIAGGGSGAILGALAGSTVGPEGTVAGIGTGAVVGAAVGAGSAGYTCGKAAKKKKK